MRFLHMADIHLGKKVNGFSMEAEQKFILDQVLSFIDSMHLQQKTIDALLIAGDVYDKYIPTINAVEMFDDFMTELVKRNVSVYVISGNHDSAERLAFGARLFASNHVHIVSSYEGKIAMHTMQDAFGDVNIYMLPYIRPVDVRHALNNEVKTYDEAFEQVINHESIDWNKRNILMAHQTITGAQKSDSEDIFIGGLDGISAQYLKGFDYAALGHLHQGQKAGSDVIRYAGSPVKYSFSEANHHKGMYLVTMQEKGDVTVEQIPFHQIHDMRKMKGSFEEIMHLDDENHEDYLSITLTDEHEVKNAMRKLRDKYPNIMEMRYENTRTQSMRTVEEIEHTDKRSPMDYINEFFLYTNGREMSAEQQEMMNQIVEKIWEEQTK